MNYESIAREILKNIGGEKNIEHVTHCATRLRFNLADDSKVNKQSLEQIKGVMGITNQGGQFQVIIGNDVNRVYEKIVALGSFNDGKSSENNAKRNVFVKIMDILAGIFTPILPAITGAGLIKAFLVLFVNLGWLSVEGQNYYILNLISDAAFYFLPIFLAYTTATKFNSNPFLAVTIGGVLLHPNLAELVKAGSPVNFMGLPVTLVSYSSSVVPIILTVWLMSYIEKWADKFVPGLVKFFLKPVLVLLIAAPMALIVIGPIGTFLGDYLATMVNLLEGKVPWLTMGILGAVSPLIIMTGMHYGLFPLMITSLSTKGYETLLMPAGLAANVAQGGASLAVALKSKNKELKQLSFSAGITAVLGITEPAMFGVTIRLKKPMIAAMIGGAVGGVFAGLVGLKAYGLAATGVASLAIFAGSGNNFIYALITAAIAFIVAFVMGWIIGFDDIPDEDNDSSKKNEKVILPKSSKTTVFSPFDGEIVPLSEVPDEAFSKELMGKGVAIIPENGNLVSPIDGKIQTIYKTKHAIGLVSNDGVEVMIHIGINTVKLKGEHFLVHVKAGDVVKKGDLLLQFDIEAIKSAGFDVITPIIITNTDNYLEILSSERKKITTGETILNLF